MEQYKDDDSYMEYLIEYMKSHPVPAQFPNFEQEAEQEHQDELNQWLEQLMNEQELLEPANAAVKDAEQKAPLAPVHHKQVAQKPAQEPFDLDDLLRGKEGVISFFENRFSFALFCFVFHFIFGVVWRFHSLSHFSHIFLFLFCLCASAFWNEMGRGVAQIGSE